MPRKGDAFHSPFQALRRLRDRLASPEPEPPARIPEPPPSAPADEELFLSEVAGARPLPSTSGRVGAPPPSGTPRKLKSDDAEVLAQLADMCRGDGPFDIADTDEYVEGTAEGVDRRLLRRLRAGEYAVQAHLDLHGLDREAARVRVDRFLSESRREGRRCVLLVHGRGLHSRDQIPVLKAAVQTWLQKGQIARAVLAFATARPCDGGTGALYVLLRRWK